MRGEWPRPIVPPPPTVEEIARALHTTPEQVREMGRRYRRYCLGLPPVPVSREARLAP